MDRNSPLPLYAQVKQALLEMLEAEVWTPGQLIPTEKELERELGVSRATVRQALAELAQEGYISRQAGKGTFVSRPKIRDETPYIGRLLEDLAERGHQTRYTILDFEALQPVPPAVSKNLDIRADDRVFRFKRLMFADGEPFGLSTVCVALPPRIELTREKVAATSSLRLILGQEYHIRAVDGVRSFEAVLASEEEHRLLQIAPKSPLLLSRTVVRDQAGRRYLFSKAVYRGDRFKYSLPLKF